MNCTYFTPGEDKFRMAQSVENLFLDKIAEMPAVEYPILMPQSVVEEIGRKRSHEDSMSNHSNQSSVESDGSEYYEEGSSGEADDSEYTEEESSEETDDSEYTEAERERKLEALREQLKELVEAIRNVAERKRAIKKKNKVKKSKQMKLDELSVIDTIVAATFQLKEMTSQFNYIASEGWANGKPIKREMENDKRIQREMEEDKRIQREMEDDKTINREMEDYKQIIREK